MSGGFERGCWGCRKCFEGFDKRVFKEDSLSRRFFCFLENDWHGFFGVFDFEFCFRIFRFHVFSFQIFCFQVFRYQIFRFQVFYSCEIQGVFAKMSEKGSKRLQMAKKSKNDQNDLFRPKMT